MFLVTFSTLGPRGPPDGPKMAPGGPKASIYHDLGPFFEGFEHFGRPYVHVFWDEQVHQEGLGTQP